VSFERLLPPFDKIVIEYGVDPPTAFYLWRPILAEKIRQYDVDLSLEMQKQKILKGLANTEKSSDSRVDTINQSLTTDTEMQAISQESSSTTSALAGGLGEAGGVESTPLKTEEYIHHIVFLTDRIRPWHPALRNIIGDVRLVLGEEVWNYLRYTLLLSFGSMLM